MAEPGVAGERAEAGARRPRRGPRGEYRTIRSALTIWSLVISVSVGGEHVTLLLSHELSYRSTLVGS